MKIRLLIIVVLVSLAATACQSADSEIPSTSLITPSPDVTTPVIIGPIAGLPVEDRMAATFTLFHQGLSAAALVDQLGVALEAEIGDPSSGDGPGWFNLSETLQEQYARVMAAEGEAAIPEIRRRMVGTEGTAYVWYLVALGYAGDDTIDADLTSALDSHPTPPVAMHLMELAASRGLLETVPTLREYLTNDLQWENQHVKGPPPLFPLRAQAAGALRRLGYTVYADPDRPGVYGVIEP